MLWPEKAKLACAEIKNKLLLRHVLWPEKAKLACAEIQNNITGTPGFERFGGYFWW